MAITQVTIIYNGPVVEIDRKGMEICRIFVPDNSYIDSPVYVNGFSREAGEGETEGYGKSIYATNVVGWGEFPGLIPMASTTTKFAQFERAVIAKFNAEAKGEANNGITFDLPEGDYMEELYWNQIAPHMVDMGFYTKVGDVEYGEKPTTESNEPSEPSEPVEP